MSQEKILIAGGTGHYGRHITKCLLQVRADVRVLTRNAEKAHELFGAEVEIVEGDLTISSDRIKALKGVTRLVAAVAAHDRKLIRRRTEIERDCLLAFFDEADHEGATRVVYLSGYEMREAFVRSLGLMHFARPQLDVEAALARSTLHWTVLGCAPSMELFFAMIRRNAMTVPGGGPASLPAISAKDVGQITAQVVLRDDLAERRFRLTGPEAFSFPEAARIIGTVWERKIRYRRIPITVLRTAAFLSKPVSPYLTYLSQAVKLMNNFPQDLAAAVPDDHRLLRETFDFEPTTLEEEARRRRRFYTTVTPI